MNANQIVTPRPDALPPSGQRGGDGGRKENCSVSYGGGGGAAGDGDSRHRAAVHRRHPQPGRHPQVRARLPKRMPLRLQAGGDAGVQAGAG